MTADLDEITLTALGGPRRRRTGRGVARAVDPSRCLALLRCTSAIAVTQRISPRRPTCARFALPSFEARSSARTWLLSIARRVCADAIRDAKRRPPTEPIVELVTGAYVVGGIGLLAGLAALGLALTGRRRRASLDRTPDRVSTGV